MPSGADFSNVLPSQAKSPFREPLSRTSVLSCLAWRKPPHLPATMGLVRYSVTCHACGATWQSTSVTGSTKCRSCRTPVYVPLAVRQAASGRQVSQRQLSRDARAPVANVPPTVTTVVVRPARDLPPPSVREARRSQPAGPTWFDLVNQLAQGLATAKRAQLAAPLSSPTPAAFPTPPPASQVAERLEEAPNLAPSRRCQCGLPDPCPLPGCRHPARDQ